MCYSTSGALDVKERASDPNTRAVVLTEDELVPGLKCLLEASGFNLEKTTVLPYYGVTSIKNLRPLINVIRATNPEAKIIIHRDRDYLTDFEVEQWCNKVRALRVEVFVTDGVDIESHFLKPDHLAELNPPSLLLISRPCLRTLEPRRRMSWCKTTLTGK